MTHDDRPDSPAVPSPPAPPHISWRDRFINYGPTIGVFMLVAMLATSGGTPRHDSPDELRIGGGIGPYLYLVLPLFLAIVGLWIYLLRSKAATVIAIILFNIALPLAAIIILDPFHHDVVVTRQGIEERKGGLLQGSSVSRISLVGVRKISIAVVTDNYTNRDDRYRDEWHVERESGEENVTFYQSTRIWEYREPILKKLAQWGITAEVKEVTHRMD